MIIKANKLKIPLIIHVGYPKTATTLIQEALKLAHGSEINYLNEFLIKELYAVAHFSKIEFDKSKELYLHEFKSRIREDLVNIISYESLTPTIKSLNNDSLPSITGIVSRLHYLFSDFDVSIVIGVRNQQELIYSTIVQAYSQNLFKSTKSNEAILEKILGSPSLSKLFNAKELLNEYGRRFSSLKIFYYEDLKLGEITIEEILSRYFAVTKTVLKSSLSYNRREESEVGYKSRDISLGQVIARLKGRLRHLPAFYKLLSKVKIFNNLIDLLKGVTLAKGVDVPFFSVEQNKSILDFYSNSNTDLFELEKPKGSLADFYISERSDSL
ncbi:MAG: hypothetical protein JXR03_11700 [Cyclobacteriaceae bacterium]